MTTPRVGATDPTVVIDEPADDPHNSAEKAEDGAIDAVAAEDAGVGGGAAASRSWFP
jgi:hypothetical protein